MSREEAWSWQVTVFHSAVARGHEELARSSRWVIFVRLVKMNPFVKPPDPRWTREQAPALSEKQVSLRSNVTASGNAQRTEDTAAWSAEAWSAEPTYQPVAQLCLATQHRACVTDGSQTWMRGQRACEPRHFAHSVRRASIHTPLSACSRSANPYRQGRASGASHRIAWHRLARQAVL